MLLEIRIIHPSISEHSEPWQVTVVVTSLIWTKICVLQVLLAIYRIVFPLNPLGNVKPQLCWFYEDIEHLIEQNSCNLV